MIIIYFLLGLGITTAHSDYGVSYRAQNFDKTVQNIDKEAYVKHQREKRFVTGYIVPQNHTNKPTWRNLNIARNHTTFTGPSSNNSRNLVANQQKLLNNGARPVIYPRQPEYVQPNVTGKYVNPGQNYNTNVSWPVYPVNNSNKVRAAGYNINVNNTSNASRYNGPVNSVTPGNTPFPGYPGYPAPNTVYPVPNTGYQVPNTGYPAQNTGYPASNTNPGQNYNTTVTRPVYPYYNNIIVSPVNKNTFNNSNPSGYNTPANTPYYPVPNTGYPASNLAPNTGYPVPNTGYPASNTGYRVPNTGYPASSGYPAPNNGYPASSGYPAPNNGYPGSSSYPVPNTSYPPPSFVIPPANVTGFVPKPNPGYTIHDPVPRNNTNGFSNNNNGFNNTASLANCKCKLPRANSTITKEERTMDACLISCNNCPDGMKMSAFGICVKDSDYDDE